MIAKTKRTFRFDRMELAGSLGDLGTLLPLAIGMIVLCDLQATAVFLLVGLFYLLAGTYFGIPVAVQPNAGLPVTEGSTVIYKETPEDMASRVPELLDLGVALVGGCCGTTPDHVRALRAAVDAWS